MQIRKNITVPLKEHNTGDAKKFGAMWWRLAPIAIAALCCAFLVPLRAQQQQQQQQRPATDARQRRTEEAKPKPTPTPTAEPPRMIINVDEPPPPAVDLSKPQNEEIDKDATVKVDTNLVNLNVRIIDRLNRPINNVAREELRVFENGVAQEIAYFTREEVPISYGLVLDNSGSLRPQINQVIDAGKSIVGSNKPGDETFLVRFVDRDHIETVQDFTSSKSALVEALEGLYVEGGQTAVRDAVYLSAERVAEYKKGDELDDRRRRALILVTDGEDRDSYYKEEELFARLREYDVQIFVVGLVRELDKEGGFIRKSPRDKAISFLERLAKETGGRVFLPESVTELSAIAEEITRDMRTQYRLGYSPVNKARDGSYRALRVTVADAAGRDKRIAVTRPGYTAPRSDAPAIKPPAQRGANASSSTTRSGKP
ncbi:MAG: VWA domain-containing protein [Pyrinomonadaceae bacterium]